MTPQSTHPEAAEEQFASAITARLSAGTNDLPRDVSERLRVARLQAIAKRKQLATQPVQTSVLASGAASLGLGNSDGGWWNRVTSALALLALVAGMVGIADLQDELRASELAEIDAELLTDDLPPAAYTDPGFAQYLRANPER